MSAPNAGRQSPEPEKQSNKQTGAQGSGEIGAAPTDTHAKDESEAQKSGLESNPEHTLQGASEAKTSKTMNE